MRRSKWNDTKRCLSGNPSSWHAACSIVMGHGRLAAPAVRETDRPKLPWSWKAECDRRMRFAFGSAGCTTRITLRFFRICLFFDGDVEV
jgi:hypothetical protein